MTIFYLLIVFAALPIIAYLLAQKTNNKGIVFGFTSIVFIICLVIFTSKFAILGSVNKQILSNKILEQVYVDSRISKENLNKIELTLKNDELKSWLINLISKSIELDKLNSAESLITFSERFFETNNEKIIFYGLYTSLRDAKFPQFKDASFIIDKDSGFPCSFKNGIAKLFVMNGPEIPIGQKEFKSIAGVKLTNLDSVIPGFDLASAHLNNETIEFNLDIFCIENGEVFSVRNLLILDKNQPSNTYKINSNEWLKKLQEL